MTGRSSVTVAGADPATPGPTLPTAAPEPLGGDGHRVRAAMTRPLGRIASHRLVVVAAVVVAALGALGLLAPVLAPDGPFRTSGERLAPPSREHLMGTDDLGRDVAVGVVYGARRSLAVALGVVAVAGALAFAVGSVAGSSGGVIDDVLMRVTELVLVLPRFFLAVATAALFGAGFVPLVAVIGLTSWPVPARILRAEILTRRELPYVEAARSMGASRGFILVRHVLPNSLGPFVVSISLLAGTAILIEAGLAFLGLADADQPSWGTMLGDAQPYLRQAPWMVLFPGLAVTLAVLALNLLGDGLVESFDRRSTRSHRR